MIRSMTGFGSATFDNGIYKIGVEMKAVNNRYRDISIRMPSGLRALEASIVEALNKSVDKKAKLKNISLIDLANFQGVINLADDSLDLEAIKPLLVATVEEATEEFVKMKCIEGENLKKYLLRRLDIIAKHTEKIKVIAPERLVNYRTQLIETLKSLLSEQNIDENRIIQECAIMADKMDITEEIVRMGSHLQQFKASLEMDGNIGRKLDFIVQEMNRETNTMASKANNAEIANLVVEIKGELEKIREQIQNIE